MTRERIKSSMITLILILAITVTRTMAACLDSQVELPTTLECVECNSLLFGCNKCTAETGTDLTTVSFQCSVCDFGRYLLQVPGVAPEIPKQSLCVSKCEDYAYNFVSNASTMQCDYCGASCTQCSSKFGCLSDYKVNHGYRMSDATVYATSNVFPYSSSGAPSTLFETAQPCADSRCDICQTYDDADGSTIRPPLISIQWLSEKKIEI